MSSKTAGIVVVGDEILKGQVQDSNSHFLCKRLRAIGTKVEKIAVVADNISDIAKTVTEFSERFDLVVTSGGIGPTHDDITYKGIARGFNEDVVLNSELKSYWELLDGVEAAHAMALIPRSAKLIWAATESVLFTKTKVKVFPVVRVHNVFVLPGVPQYFQTVVTSLEKEYFKSHGISFYTGRIYLSVDEELYLDALNKTVEELNDCVFGSYPVIGNSKYKTQITVEAVSVDRVRAAENFFKALVPPTWIVSWCDEMANPVYKFLEATEDPRMATTLDNSVKVVEQAFDQYQSDELMVSFNGGKDCTVLLHIVLAVKERKGLSSALQAVYFQPPNPFPEVEQFIRDTVARHQVKLTTIPGSIKSALALLIQQKPDLKGIFLGTRRTDPYSQNLKEFQMTDPGWAKVMRINPILDWSYQDIWTFLRGIASPYCSLYDQGYTSLGNQDNTRPNPCLLNTEANATQTYKPAWMLTDNSVERHGRL